MKREVKSYIASQECLFEIHWWVFHFFMHSDCSGKSSFLGVPSLQSNITEFQSSGVQSSALVDYTGTKSQYITSGWEQSLIWIISGKLADFIFLMSHFPCCLIFNVLNNNSLASQPIPILFSCFFCKLYTANSIFRGFGFFHILLTAIYYA